MYSKMSNALRTRLQTSRVFLLSSLSWEERKEYGKIIQQLGGICFDSECFKASCTHLVCGRLSRSEKFLGACATGKWILRPDYILASQENKDWLPEDDYEWHPSNGKSEQSNLLIYAPIRCRLQFALTGEPAFKGWKVAVSVSDTKRALVYKRLLTSGGAQLYSLKLPVKDPVKVANTITFIFSDKKMAEQLMKQSLMDYGLLLLKPEFIGDYLIKDPHPNPMDYIVTPGSTSSSPEDKMLIQSSQDDKPILSQSSSHSTSRRSLDLGSKSERSFRVRTSLSNLGTNLSKSQESARISLNVNLSQEAAKSEKDFMHTRSVHSLKAPDADMPPSSQRSSKSRKLLKAKPRSTTAKSDDSASRIHPSSQETKTQTIKGAVNEFVDGHFLSLETASVNSTDTSSSQGARRVSRRLAGVDPYQETKSSVHPSIGVVNELEDSHFLSLETAPVNSNDTTSSQAARRISRKLAGVDPFIEYTARKDQDNPENDAASSSSLGSKQSLKALKSQKHAIDDFVSVEIASFISTAIGTSQGSRRVSRSIDKTEKLSKLTSDKAEEAHIGQDNLRVSQRSRTPTDDASVGSNASSRRLSGWLTKSKMDVETDAKQELLVSTTDKRKISAERGSSQSQQSEASAKTLSIVSASPYQASPRMSMRSARAKPIVNSGVKKCKTISDKRSLPLSHGSTESVATASTATSGFGYDSQKIQTTNNGSKSSAMGNSEDTVSDKNSLASSQRSVPADENVTVSLSECSGTTAKSSTRMSKRLSGSRCISSVSLSALKIDGTNPELSLRRESKKPLKRTRQQNSKSEFQDDQYILLETNFEANALTPQLRKLSKRLNGIDSNMDTGAKVPVVKNLIFEERNRPDTNNVTSSQKSTAPSPFQQEPLSSSQQSRSLRLAKTQEPTVKNHEPIKDLIIILSDCESYAPGQESKSVDKNLVAISRSRSGSIKRTRSQNRFDQSGLQIKSLNGIFTDRQGKETSRSSRNSSATVVTDLPFKQESDSQNSNFRVCPNSSRCSQSRGTPKKVSKEYVPAHTPSLSQASPRKLSQSSLQDFGFSSASKRRPRGCFSRLLSKASSCSGSPVSMSQGSGRMCSQSEGALKESELLTLVPSREEAMEPDATIITDSLEKIKIEKDDLVCMETGVKPTKTETPTNNTMTQTCGAKRKIFEDEEDRADVTKPAVKRMKLSCPVQPWKPAPLGLKVDHLKDSQSDCSVPNQIPSSVCSLINSCVEEEFQQEALMFLQSTSQLYPTSETLNTIMTQVLLKAKSAHIAQTAYRVLMSSLSMHPPTSKLVKDVYVNAFRLQDQATGEGVWEFVSSVINGALSEEMDGGQEKHCLLLRFIVAVFRYNFNSFLEEFESSVLDNSRRSLFRSCMLLQCLWYPSYMMFPNARTQQLLASLEQCLLLPSSCRYKAQVLECMLSLVSMAAQCCYAADHNRLTSVQLDLGERTSLFVSELARKIVGSCIKDENLYLTTLRILQPSWLCLKVCQILLGNLDDYLLVTRPDNRCLTLTKIVSQYFYLLPRLSRTGSDSKGQTLEIAAPRKRGRPRKTPTKSDSGAGDSFPTDMAAKINKQNYLGETALHIACIKNDVPKLRQLLQVPGVDVNVQDNAGWTPLHEACNKGHIDCVEALLKYVPVRTVETYFKQEGNSRRVDLLATNPDGVTPLHDAVSNNRLDVCRLLLKHGGQSLLKAQTKLGLYPKDLANTPSMFNLLMTPPTPIKHGEDEINSSQDSVSSPGPNRTDFLPSVILYDQVLGQDGCLMRASLSDCSHYITMVTFLLQSYLHSTKLLVQQTHQKTTTYLPVLDEKPSCMSKENKVPHKMGRRTRKPSRLSDYVCGKETILGEANSDVENGRWLSLNGMFDTEYTSTAAKQTWNEDLKVFRRLKYHLKNFSFHISKITSPEDFKLLERKLLSLKVCTMAAAQLN